MNVKGSIGDCCPYRIRTSCASRRDGHEFDRILAIEALTIFPAVLSAPRVSGRGYEGGKFKTCGRRLVERVERAYCWLTHAGLVLFLKDRNLPTSGTGTDLAIREASGTT
jgi:hypothetical protein